jgi:hypothetical protein
VRVRVRVRVRGRARTRVRVRDAERSVKSTAGGGGQRGHRAGRVACWRRVVARGVAVAWWWRHGGRHGLGARAFRAGSIGDRHLRHPSVTRGKG